MKRRQFLHAGLAVGGAVLASKVPFPRAWAQSSSTDSRTIDSRIEILTGEPLGTISPNLYGHFTENLSGVVYDGIWVGPNSKVPNVDGIRKELIDEMRKIKAPVVRFPGGCFADSYDWREGIGPTDKRPLRTNFWNAGSSGFSPIRSKSVRHQRVRAFLQADRQRAVFGRKPAQPARRRTLPLGRILQLSSGQHDRSGYARGGRIQRSLQRALLGRGQ